MLYSYAKLSPNDFGIFRFRGWGLGNLLLPWARFVVATDQYGLAPIWPTWFQMSIGPTLRGESDKRFYSGLFLRDPASVAGPTKLFLLSTAPRMSEDDFLRNPNAVSADANDRVIVFEGLKGYFTEILKSHELIHRELLKITRDRHKAGLSYDFSKTISLHIRLGDQTANPQHHIPLDWYVEQVRQVREAAGDDIPALIFSDGSDDQLAAIMKLPRIKRVFFGSALADLLAMARSRVLVGASSTFSAWASFLGRMPVIWHTGHRKQPLYYEEGDIEIETDGRIPLCALDSISHRLHAENSTLDLANAKQHQSRLSFAGPE